MSLIKCPECQHDVSSEATFCPNCGHPFNKEKKETKRKSFTVAYRSGAGGIVTVSIISLIFGVIFLTGGLLLLILYGKGAMMFPMFFLIGISVFLLVASIVLFRYMTLNAKQKYRNCIEYDSDKDKLILCTLYGEKIEINVEDYISLKDNFWTDNMLYFTYRTRSGTLRKLKLGYCGNRDDIRANIASIKK